MKKHQKTILSLMEKCRTMSELKQIHGLMITTSLFNNVIQLSSLVDFCANSDARDLG